MENEKKPEKKRTTKAFGGQMMNMPNPVSSLTEEEAKAIAESLGDGKDMGSWRTMSGKDFMKWYESSRKKEEDDD